MSYVIQAALSNPRRPECGQITIPFPIPVDQYDQTIEMLRTMGLGDATDQDCTVDKLDSRYSVLGALEGALVNVDQLDYLAKRLDSLCVGEDAQFQGMACKMNMSDIEDFIDLTFCCQQATVITDFSDLEAVGRSHFINLNGGCATMEELKNLDGEETALLLIDSNEGVVTPYGVVYDNGMVLEQVYNGRQLPAYPYDSTLLVLEVTPKQGLAEGDSPEYLYLPASERQIERTLLRAGITALHNAQVRLDFDELPEKAAEALDLEHLSGGDLLALNKMCQIIASLNEADQEKLNAAVCMAEPGDMTAVCQLAEHLDQFDFIPGIHTPEEYGRYMIQESGHFEYDENLDGFYDYRRCGEQRIWQESGQFNEYGYVAYHGTMSLEELMMEDPTEQYQREQGPADGRAAIMAERTKTVLLTLTASEKKYPLVLPAAEEQLEQAKQALEVEDFSQAVIAGVEYVAPYLNQLIPMDRVTVEDANELAEYLQQFSEDELRTYWSALEAEQPDTFAEALNIAIDCDDYELVPEDRDEYGKQVLRRIGADDEIIDTIDGYMDFAQLGTDSLAEDGVRRTEFGLVRRLSMPFPPGPEIGQTMM